MSELEPSLFRVYIGADCSRVVKAGYTNPNHLTEVLNGQVTKTMIKILVEIVIEIVVEIVVVVVVEIGVKNPSHLTEVLNRQVTKTVITTTLMTMVLDMMVMVPFIPGVVLKQRF